MEKMIQTRTLMLSVLSFLGCFLTGSLVDAAIDSLVKVYDNVLPDETRELLHNESVAWDNDDVVFIFPLQEPEKHSAMEQIMNSVLLELYPAITEATYYVEYWKREGWYHILPHADMDEELRAEQEEQGLHNEPFAHPETGHVLYLKMGSRVRGPTCVWNVSNGGQLLSEEEQGHTDMIVVPSVESRLLRFQGHLLHAVPRPADVWMDPTYESQQEPVVEWGRSVLLFNTWRIDKGKLRGREVSSATADKETRTNSKLCNRKDEWIEANVREIQPSSRKADIEFPLMGDAKRRGTEERSVILETASNSQPVFFEAHQPSKITVHPKQRRARFTFMGVEF